MDQYEVFAVMPSDIQEFWQAIDAVAPTYLVGGAVRDLLRHEVPHDWDFATALSPEAIVALGDRAGYRVLPTGLRFGTVTVVVGTWAIEVTTFRREGRYLDRRRPAEVTFVPSIEEDLRRRDLTINAMAMDAGGNLCDPLGGADDLQHHIVRAVGDPHQRFAEDPLRMMRAVRFLGLDPQFRLDGPTLDAIIKNQSLLVQVSYERQTDEMKKILVTPSFAQAIATLDMTGLLSAMWPEWQWTRNFEQRNSQHPLPLHQHLLLAASYGSTLVLRLAGLLHDIAKPHDISVDERGLVHYYEHDSRGAEMVRQMLTRHRWDHRTVTQVEELVAWHRYAWETASDLAIRRMLREHGWNRVQALLELRRNDRSAMKQAWAEEAIVRKRIDTIFHEASPDDRRLQITGDDVMRILSLPQGRKVGEVLRALQDWVDEDMTRNHPQILVDYVLNFDRQ